MNESGQSNRAASDGNLVFEETIRHALRKTPQERFDSLRAALREADKRGLIPTRPGRTRKASLGVD